MIIWINGAFGAGKTQTAFELNRRIKKSFIYDPENLGFFLSKNIPQNMKKDDFQDYDMWRELNFSLIKHIEDSYEGILIIPMTIVKPEYFREIIETLRSNGVEVKHYALMASKETLLKRLKSRGDGSNSWGAKQIDRCLEGLSNEIFETHINTENMSIEEVAEKIALMSDLSLMPNNMSRLEKSVYRIKVKLRHINLFS
ncbi:hypothetical protein HMPREF1982_02338 [Clostridiales bacterium oral taxon 876 str. F0540]|nr:hypothetical protein HMPREF1982_02338 [Clostridiales bacterium oral taxon 876 str. F0540]